MNMKLVIISVISFFLLSGISLAGDSSGHRKNIIMRDVRLNIIMRDGRQKYNYERRSSKYNYQRRSPKI